MVSDPLAAGASEAAAPGLADLEAATSVLVVGRDVADGGAQAHLVLSEGMDKPGMAKEMTELYIEGVAIHGGPESCVVSSGDV